METAEDRPQHLRDAMQPGFKDELVKQMTALVSILARGQDPPEVKQAMNGASLAALPKPDGTHRPIAVGETLRRLTGKCLAAAVKEDVKNILEPCQVGVGTAGGCEAVVHLARGWLEKHSSDSDRVLAQLDLTNAFNCLDRQ